MTEYVDIAALAEGATLPWLHGFWDENHNIPGPPALVQGDAARFESDCLAAAARSIERLNRYAGIRWMMLAEWDRWDFTPEIWRTRK